MINYRKNWILLENWIEKRRAETLEIGEPIIATTVDADGEEDIDRLSQDNRDKVIGLRFEYQALAFVQAEMERLEKT